MKKFLLLAATAFTCMSAFAQESEVLNEVFGYCPDGDYTKVKYGGPGQADTQVGGAIFFPSEILEDWDGGNWYVTEFHVMSGNRLSGTAKNTLTTAVMFMREELDGISFYRQNITLSEEFKAWNIITLDEPQPVDSSRPFYIGMVGVTPDNNCAPLVYDGIKIEDNEGNGCWVYNQYMGWDNNSSFLGSLMMRVNFQHREGNAVATVDGDKTYMATAGTGVIELKGEFDTAEIYSLGGTRVASVNSPASVSLASGLYAVSFNGQPAQKVMVK